MGDDVDPFAVIMTGALDAGLGRSGLVGNATSHLLPAVDLGSFGMRWIEERFAKPWR